MSQTVNILLQSITHHFNKKADQIAIEQDDFTATYDHLAKDVGQIEQYLLTIPVKAGETISVFVEDRYLAIAAILALQKQGCGYLPLDPVYPEERLRYMLTDSESRVLLTDGDVFNIPTKITLNVKTGELQESSTESSPYCIPKPGYTIYTSGSTGTPKGVELPLPVLENLISWQNKRYQKDACYRTAQFSALSFDVSFQEIFSTLALGGTLVLLPNAIKQDFRQLITYLIEKRVQRIFLPYIALLNMAQWACRLGQYPTELREVITAGEQLICNDEIKQFFKECSDARLSNQYGPSESHVVSEYILPTEVSSWPKIPPIGKAINNAQLFVVDEQLQVIGSGEGELLIGGPVIANGYRNKAKQTQERFVNLTINGEQQRVYRTGDSVEKNGDGNLQYKGRIDSQIKINGYRVETDEVEANLMALSDIDEAAIAVFGTETGQKKLIAFVVSPKPNFQPQQVLIPLAESLPGYMVPSHFEVRSSLLRTPSGKIDRKTMLGQWAGKQKSKKIPESSSQQILSIIRSQLSNNDIEESDNLLDVGMDSMAANHMSARCFDELSLDIPAYLFFQYRSIRALINAVEQRSQLTKRVKVALGKAGQKEIAVVGLSIRAPGADNVEEFWRLISEGIETIHEFKPVTKDGWVNARGILKSPAALDAPFFRLTPGEAEMIDPQQRLLLELSWEALEDGGVVAEEFAGRIGVFCGTGNNSYYLSNVLRNVEKHQVFGGFQAMIANEKDYSATRIAHKLNLKGPAVNVQSACSTSLVAICQAVRSLRSGECEMALAGGSSIYYPQQQPYQYEEGAINSKDGHTRTFDADSSGTVFSDGGAVVLLKTLDQAIADNDAIYGIIKGIGVNNDGSEKGSFSAPSVEGQKRVIQAAQQDAGVSPRQIEYLEAHGTATPIGDPIEMAALREVFTADTSETAFCNLGSVKSNFGHLTAAAGVVSVIKSLLAIQKGEQLPLVNFKAPNPALQLDSSPFTIQTQRSPWNQPLNQRMAGVSSFGIGGTNAHVVLAGYGQESEKTEFNPIPFPLCISAKSKRAAIALSTQYQDWLKQSPDIDVRSLPYQVFMTRQQMDYRIAAFGDTSSALIASLTKVKVVEKVMTDRSIVFAFPGQGVQMLQMGKALYQQHPTFRDRFEECVKECEKLGVDIKAIIFEDESDLSATQYTQLALFIVGYSLAASLQEVGVQPDALIGHSIGELCAAVISGVFDLPTAIQVVYWRGKYMQAQPSGSMAAVRTNIETVEPYLNSEVEVAAVNTQEAITITGPHKAIDETLDKLSAQGIVAKKLKTSHAFHSQSMSAAEQAFRDALVSVSLNKPSIPFLSCVSGEWITDNQATRPDYWGQQIRKPVQFMSGAQQILALKNPLIFEMGPKSTAIGMINLVKLHDQQEAETQCDFIPLLPNAGSDSEHTDFCKAIGKAWALGANLQLPELKNPFRKQRIPCYPFQRKIYEIKPDTICETDQNKKQQIAEPILQETGVISVKDTVVTQLKSLLEETSGVDLDDASVEDTFFEIGFDSLFLTQCIAKIKKQFKVTVTFRELMNDCNSLSKLADKLIEKGVQINTPDPVSTTVQAVPVTPVAESLYQPAAVSAQPVTTGNSQLVQLFNQQMELINAQMAMLRGGQVNANTQPNVAPQHATQKAPVSTDVKKIKPFGAGVRINVNRTNELTPVQEENLAKLAQRYNKKFSESKSFAQNNRAKLADPRVVSGFRSALKELIYPVVVNKSNGAYLWDIQGNQLVDVTCGFGSNFFGHSAGFVKDAVIKQVNQGYEIGPQHPLVADLSMKFCQITGAERVAFCNTGSEAVLGAVRLARTVTSKDHVVMFENDYHGINDEVIVHRGGDGHSAPAAAGIPESAVDNTMMLDYGDNASLTYIEEHADDIAAILVEPVQSRNPELQPKEFLYSLRRICDQHDIALIFDEVITGFRIHAQGAQGYFEIQADIATYGKVIGGGMPIGVIAGRSRFMDALDGGTWRFGDDSAPEIGVTYFAGTFVRHPLALAAANAVLDKLISDPECQQRLNQTTQRMVDEINVYIDHIGAPMKVVNCGSLFRFVIPQDIGYEELIYILLREKGIHIWDARPCFLTLAHSDQDVAKIISAVKQSIDEMISMTFFSTSIAKSVLLDEPPVPGARLGKDSEGNPAWYLEDPDQPGKYQKLELSTQ